MGEYENRPWAHFAERFAKELLEHDVSEAAIVTRQASEDRITTNYYNCNFEKRCVLIGHMIEDLILEVIEVNKETVLRLLDEEDDDEDR